MSAAFEEVVVPAAERFRPDIILVRDRLREAGLTSVSKDISPNC